MKTITREGKEYKVTDHARVRFRQRFMNVGSIIDPKLNPFFDEKNRNRVANGNELEVMQDLFSLSQKIPTKDLTEMHKGRAKMFQTARYRIMPFDFVVEKDVIVTSELLDYWRYLN